MAKSPIGSGAPIDGGWGPESSTFGTSKRIGHVKVDGIEFERFQLAKYPAKDAKIFEGRQSTVHLASLKVSPAVLQCVPGPGITGFQRAAFGTDQSALAAFKTTSANNRAWWRLASAAMVAASGDMHGQTAGFDPARQAIRIESMDGSILQPTTVEDVWKAMGERSSGGEDAAIPFVRIADELARDPKAQIFRVTIGVDHVKKEAILAINRETGTVNVVAMALSTSESGASLGAAAHFQPGSMGDFKRQPGALANVAAPTPKPMPGDIETDVAAISGNGTVNVRAGAFHVPTARLAGLLPAAGTVGFSRFDSEGPVQALGLFELMPSAEKSWLELALSTAAAASGDGLGTDAAFDPARDAISVEATDAAPARDGFLSEVYEAHGLGEDATRGLTGDARSQAEARKGQLKEALARVVAGMDQGDDARWFTLSWRRNDDYVYRQRDAIFSVNRKTGDVRVLTATTPAFSIGAPTMGAPTT
jgi:hypothetical protein